MLGLKTKLKFWCSIEQWSNNSHMNQSEKLMYHTLNFKLPSRAYLIYLSESMIKRGANF